MSDTATVERPIDQGLKSRPNVVDVGAWLASAKTLRHELANYVPRHRAPGPAV